MLRTLSLLLGGALLCAPAFANRPAMDPQVRLHLGASMVPGPGSLGLTGGLDSRLTRTIFVDAGGMATLMQMPEDAALSEEPGENFRLRHSIYLTPGLRIPHRQPNGFSWDVIFRGGAGMIWTADLDSSEISVAQTPAGYGIEVDPAGVGGADLLVRRNTLGVRVSGRVYAARPMHNKALQEYWYWSPQGSLEAIYQF